MNDTHPEAGFALPTGLTLKTIVVHTIEEFRVRRAELPGSVAVVMTMGALHDGHASLVEHARTLADHVIVTIFVNPLQFGPTEDYSRYPRTLDADVELLAPLRPALIFAPSAEVMYPGGQPQVTIAAGPMGTRYEGAVRPGHFDGMLTVVNKLLSITTPDIAVFGQKDAQQVALIQRMVTDLNINTRIVVAPTIREADGLAMSSRNRYLSADDRRVALTLSRSLRAGQEFAAKGAAPQAIRDAAQATFGDSGVALDYVALVDPATFDDVNDGFVGEAVLAVAGKVGTTRLIDNTLVTIS